MSPGVSLDLLPSNLPAWPTTNCSVTSATAFGRRLATTVFLASAIAQSACEPSLTTRTTSLGLDPESIRIENNTDSMMAITEIDEAFGRVQDQLIRLGGIQRELTGLENILSGSIPPEEAIQSLYGDADIAQEQVALTKLQLFSQLATGQVATSNARSGQILSLLG